MSTDNKLIRLFPIIHNVKPFITREHPEYHPDTKEYEDYWDNQEKLCIEGLWGLDKSEETGEGGWRYCPPQLRWYANFCPIEQEDPIANSIKVDLPLVRDVEWLFFYNWFICRGFSGYEDDDEYSCNLILAKIQNGDLLTTKDKIHLKELKSIYKKDGTYKKYIDAREYLYKTHDKPLGLPLYENESQNIMVLTSRRQGKSMWLVAILSHMFKFHGAIRFDQAYFNLKRGPAIVIGSVLGKSADTLKHFSFLEEYHKNNFGSYGEDENFIPGFFYQQVSGSLTTSNQKSPYRNEYLEKVNNVDLKKGKGTRIVHVTYEDNAEAAVGQGPLVSIIEEVGLVNNLLKVLGANEPGLKRNIKFGSHLAIGCVCAGTKVWTKDGRLINIEDLKKSDGILGHNQDKPSKEPITYMQEPVYKECYKITLEGGNELECSYDHPILTTSANLQYMNKGNKYRDAVFVEAKDITIDDYVFLLNQINLFGNINHKYARLLGLMVGDGYYGKIPQMSLCTDQKGIQNYIENNIKVKIKKQFIIPKNNEKFIEYNIKDSQVVDIIRNNGMLGQTREHKTFPNDIHTYDKESLANFIGGYFDADGHVKYNEKNKKITISLTSKYKSLVTEMKFQLSKFGIDSTIYKEVKKTGYLKQNTDSRNVYVLYINKNKDVKTFIKNISFLSEYKQERLNKPITANRQFNRRSVLLKGDSIEKTLKGLISKRVKKVEPIGLKRVYNLTANKTHTYLANNIITHNTAGNMEKIHDTKTVFENPDQYYFIGFPDLWENRKKNIGLFIPGYYVDNSFRDEHGNQNIEEAYAEEMRIRADKSKADNSYALDAYMMDRPLVPSEMFLTGQANIFPIAKLRDQLNKVEIQELYETFSFKGTLEWNKTKTGVSLNVDLQNRLKPILSTNLDGYKNNLKGACVFYEAPEEKVPNPTQKRSLYKVVYDPYRDDGEGTSLASIIVYKGISEDNWAEGLQDDIVGEYIGRMDKVDDVHEIAVQMAIYYNAKIMVETNIADFIRYCKREGWAHLLQAKPTDAIAAAVKNPGKKYDVGIDMTSPALQEQAEQLWRQWLLTEWKTLDNGVVLLNLNKLKSPMILKQLIQYNRKGNFDHVSALKLLALWLSQEKRVPIQQSSEVAKDTLNTYFNKMQLTKKTVNINQNYYNY